eukprot:759209-Hanusia_phi.AAC.13
MLVICEINQCEPLMLVQNEDFTDFLAFSICMFSTHHQLGDGDKIGTLDSAEDSAESKTLRSNFYLRLAIFFTAILTEILTWSAILVSGILWISSSPTIDLVIRSTVAVMFVLNVDEIVFESDSAALLQSVKTSGKQSDNLLSCVRKILMRSFLTGIESPECSGAIELMSLSSTTGAFTSTFLFLFLLLVESSTGFGSDWNAKVTLSSPAHTIETRSIAY